MASLGNIEEFDVANPHAWDAYAERLEFYFQANDVTSNEKKRAVLLSVCGPKTYGVVRSLISPDTPATKSYVEIVGLLKNHFSPKPSEIYQRFKFHRRNQQDQESVAEYIAELRRLAEHCNFGNNLDLTLRDRFVCGMRDEMVQRRLLSETVLTFAQAQEKALAAEAALQNTREIRGASAPVVNTDYVAPGTSHRKDYAPVEIDQVSNRNQAPRHFQSHKCSGCGGPHFRGVCRFKNVECYYCKKKGHLEKVCRVKAADKAKGSVNKVVEMKDAGGSTFPGSTEDQVYHLWNVTVQGAAEFCTTVVIEGHPVEMELDTGAGVSIVDESTFHQIYPQESPVLTKSTVILQDYSQNAIETLGACEVAVKYGSRESRLPLIVSRGHHRSLLGRNWMESLGIEVRGVLKVCYSVSDLVGEYPDVFSAELGEYKGPPISFLLDGEVTPLRLKPRAVPFALLPKIEKEIDKLVAQGVYTPILHSEWGTPIVPVLKPNGEVRLCGDYKSTLNKALKKDLYPIPPINQLLTKLHGGIVFAKIDLAQAFQQLRVDEEAAVAQTIVTHKGAFKVNRLQFGVSVAPGKFQRLMEELLAGMDSVLPYFDDVLVKGKSMEDLCNKVRLVLQRFREAGIHVKAEKCVLGAPEVTFLGYVVDQKGIRPTPDKVRAIQEAPVPSNKEELQAYLGLLNFYHSFLQNKADVAGPLHQLLQKASHWDWTQVHDEAFAATKGLLSSESLLAHYDPNRPLFLTCDASQYGVGAVLSQPNDNGEEVPVCFYSRTMTAAERNYAQIDREALSIIAAVKKFHNYLYGRHFEIRTDHKPLLGLFTVDKVTPNIISPRMLRWSILLSGYDFALVYKPGRSIPNADGLSRLPRVTPEFPVPAPMEILLLEALDTPPLTAHEIADLTKKDPILSRVYNWAMKGWPNENSEVEFEPFIKRQHELTTHRGCLLWGNRVVIPGKARKHILQTLHACHQGIVRTKALARSYVWWPGLDKEVEEMGEQCDVCQSSRHSPPKAPNHPWEWTRKPWSRLHVDFAGPVGGQVFLVVVDSYSKWLEVLPVASTDTKSVVTALRTLFATHGIPDVIVSDNGTAFASAAFINFASNNGIRLVKVAPYHPSSNGQAERMVQSMKETLKRMRGADLPQRLARMLLTQHVTPSAATGACPAELLMGRRLRTCLDRVHPDFVEEMKSKQEASAKPIPPRKFAPQDLVFALNMGRGPKWVPAVVMEITGPLSYSVLTDEGIHLKRHIDQLRRRYATPGADVGEMLPQASSKVVGSAGAEVGQPAEAHNRAEQADASWIRPPSPDDEVGFRGFESSMSQQASPRHGPSHGEEQTVVVDTPSSTRPRRATVQPRWTKDFVM